MPVQIPQRRPRGFTRWHVFGLTIGYTAAMAAVFWIAMERASLPEPTTTGIAPASQSGRPQIR